MINPEIQNPSIDDFEMNKASIKELKALFKYEPQGNINCLVIKFMLDDF
ncbi:hypothetical protein B4144_3998 [Bacillus atrophaeus]|nr:hypothetical protein B4144_3998 [Bacillus atrophaeus]